MTDSLPRLAVLISGTGRNLQAIMDAIEAGRIRATLVAVISNRADALGLDRARRAGVPAHVIPSRGRERADFEHALDECLAAYRPDMVVLAGFMRILGAEFVQRYAGRLLNIHPSLLPKYPGLHTHDRALAAGDRWHGASVHYVTEELDGGPVVLQGRIAIAPGDTADTLAGRVMEEVERHIYPIAVSWLAEGRLRLVDGQVWLDGRPLDHPPLLEELHADTNTGV